MMDRKIGFSACILAVVLLGVSLLGARSAKSYEIRETKAMAAPAGAPAVSDAWVRLPAVPGRPGGGYMMVTGGKTADALIAVTSPAAGRVEMHSMKMDGNVMRMRAETALAVPAGGMLHLAPGGMHLMLFDLKSDLKPGDSIRLDLMFRSGTKITTQAVARSIAEQAPANHHHNH